MNGRRLGGWPTFLALVLAAGGLQAQQGPRIPSPAEALGYQLGEQFTDHARVVRYLETLATGSPIVRIREYGQSVERRPLLQVVIARQDYLSRLDEILERNRRLTDPETTEAEARHIAENNPAIVYFSYGVHGNESSSSEAALWTAYDLVRNADNVRGVLDSVVVIIDPAVNPDGRERYVGFYNQARSKEVNPNPESREHVEPWPGGRFNHYLFDLNRDWAWMTQQETRARLATWGYWSPQVHVDFHEMSPNSSYFFFPAADPINPMYPAHILDWGKYFGAANAAAFDRHGWRYFTGESYDLFYPGYGDSWPSLNGAIGMTYEQAGGGSAGLAYRRSDGDTLTLRRRAEQHWTSGVATLRASAARKSALLLDYARFHRTQGEGLPDILLVPGRDPNRMNALVKLLRAQGIQVERATAAFKANTRPHQGFASRESFPAGTYRVRARQPRGRLALTLLQPETMLKATYSYDVSAWSLPFAYGVEAHSADRLPGGSWMVVDSVRPVIASAKASVDSYGYLVPPSVAAWPAVIRYLELGGRARVLAEGFTIEGTHWPAGTIYLPRSGNGDFGARIDAAGLAQVGGQPVNTGRAARGNDLGTEESYPVELPKLAVVTGQGVNATSYGAHWHFLENVAGLKFDAVPADRLESTNLDRYSVIVLPEMGRPASGDRFNDALKRWVQAGGTLIAVGNGARSIAAPLADIKLRADSSSKASGDAKLERALRGREARDLEQWEQEIPGTILSVNLDPAHPLTFGAGVAADSSRMFVLHTGGAVFEPDENFESAAYFGDKLNKVSGVISQENLNRLGRATWLANKRVGRGRVILFADDPLFRAFWYTSFQPWFNALMIGPRL